jgi:hypothetical protein
MSFWTFLIFGRHMTQHDLVLSFHEQALRPITIRAKLVELFVPLAMSYLAITRTIRILMWGKDGRIRIMTLESWLCLPLIILFQCMRLTAKQRFRNLQSPTFSDNPCDLVRDSLGSCHTSSTNDNGSNGLTKHACFSSLWTKPKNALGISS